MVKAAAHTHHLTAERALQFGERLQRRHINLPLAYRAGAEKGLFWDEVQEKGFLKGYLGAGEHAIYLHRIVNARNYRLLD